MRLFSSRAVGIIAGSLLLGVGLVWSARSCGTVDRSLIGVWEGYGPLPAVAQEDPGLARSLAGVTLTLDGSGKFRVVDGGIPLSGQWRRQEDALTFDVETLMDRPLGTQPDAAKKAAGAFLGRVQGEEIVLRALSGADVRLKRTSQTVPSRP